MSNVKFHLLRNDMIDWLNGNSYQELSDRSGVSRSTISRIVGSMQTCDPETIVKLATGIGKPVAKYFNDDKNKVIYYPSDNTVDKIRAILQADETLTEEHRTALVELMRIAYNQFVKI